MKTHLPFASAVLLLLVACAAQDEKPVPTPDVLSGVPVLAQSQLLDTSGTAEAAEANFLVQLSPDSVAASYRRYFATHEWRLVGDVSDQGGTDLYAERQGPPLWIRIRPAGKGFTRYTMIGALGRSASRLDSAAAQPDSAAGKTGRPPAPGGAGH